MKSIFNLLIPSAMTWASATPSALGVLVTLTDPSHSVWNDRVAWSSKGAAFDLLGNPFTATSVGGTVIGVGSGSGFDLERADEGDGWLGNFWIGEPLLYSGFGSAGPITISFDHAVRAAGAAFQSATLGGFHASIEVFDTFGIALGSVIGIGSSTQDQDGSAMFLGFHNDTVNVGSIVINVMPDDLTATADFSIGSLRLGVPTVVPETSTTSGLLLASGSILALIHGRTRRSRV